MDGFNQLMNMVNYEQHFGNTHVCQELLTKKLHENSGFKSELVGAIDGIDPSEDTMVARDVKIHAQMII